MRHLYCVLLIGLFACSAESTDTGSATGSNMPPLLDSGPSCPQEIVDAPTLAVCAKATQTCLEACKDEPCVDACFAMDPAAEECAECLDDAYLACVNAAGCQADYDALECCAAGCADPDSDACYTVTCKAQSDAYEQCTTQKDGNCDDAVCYKTT